MGIDGAGVGVAGLRIGVLEFSKGLVSHGEGERTISGEEVGARVCASGVAAEECVEDVKVDVGMAIAGGIHMSIVVDWLCDSCLYKE